MNISAFSDEEENRKATMLRISSITIFLGAIAGLLIFIIQNDINMILAFSFMLIGAIISLLLLRFGHIKSASWTVLLWLLASLMLVLYLADGIHDMIILLFPISIMIASMLFEKRDLIAYSLIVFLSIQIFAICELTGIINNRMSHFTTILDVISVGILMFTSIVLAYKMSESNKRSFLRANQNNISLTKINQKLQVEEEERNKAENQLKTKLNDLEKSERAALNIMEDLNETVQTLKKVEKELAFKNKELEDYTYTVSHDLKAPLVTIQGFSELLGKQYEDQLDDKAKHYLDRINQGSENLARLVSDLLELSRAGRKTKKFERHDFNEILELSLDGLEGKIRENNVKIQKPDDFPKVHCDEMRLSQVMSNLIGNSINYMGDEKSPTIQIGWAENDNMYEFWVQDNGIGIKDEDKDRVFNIFERAADSSAEGTGIGLSIVKKIIQVHGGNIWVDSKFGNGSKFTFTIPVGEK